jgi:hypothetical protein
MKRILAALFLALVVALVGTIGVASADPPHNFTTGGGKVVVTLIPDSTRVEKFAFSAHAIGSTTGARNGHYVYEQTQTFTEVPPTCEVGAQGERRLCAGGGQQSLFRRPDTEEQRPQTCGIVCLLRRGRQRSTTRQRSGPRPVPLWGHLLNIDLRHSVAR